MLRKTTKRRYDKKQRKIFRQLLGGFLSRYDFAYAGRDTMNQAIKGLDGSLLKFIDKTSKEIDKISGEEIRQVINEGCQKIKKCAPQFMRGAVEDVHKTSSRLLGNFCDKEFGHVKKKLLQLVKRN